MVIVIGLLMVMPITIVESHTTPQPFWEGSVTLVENTTCVIKAKSGKTYEIDYVTALGALDKAAKKGNFSYTVDDSWYAQYGALFVDSIAGKKNKGMDGWQYWVNYPNDPIPMTGADKYKVKNGDTVDWFYGGYGSNPDNAKMLIRIHVNVVKDREKPIVGFEKPRGGIYIFNREIVHFYGISYIIGKITVKAFAYDNLSGINKVEFYVDGNIKKTCNEMPYQWNWNETAIGTHVLKVIAYDEVGNSNQAIANIWIITM